MRKLGFQRKNSLVSVVKTIVHGGLESFGRYYSSYRAFVVDREDPEKLSRIKVIIPQITGDNIYNYWVFPKNVFSGQNYGSQVLPQRGDLVWIEFEGGHPEVPIWSHGHFGKKEKPKDDDCEDYDTYWFKTPKGHLVILNDTKNLIRIKSNLGDTIEINEKAISLVTDRKISLGSLDTSQYKALHGETTRDTLRAIHGLLKEINETLQKDLDASGGGAFLKYVNLKIKNPTWKPKIKDLKEQIETILSNKVTLD